MSELIHPKALKSFFVSSSLRGKFWFRFVRVRNIWKSYWQIKRVSASE